LTYRVVFTEQTLKCPHLIWRYPPTPKQLKPTRQKWRGGGVVEWGFKDLQTPSLPCPGMLAKFHVPKSNIDYGRDTAGALHNCLERGKHRSAVKNLLLSYLLPNALVKILNSWNT